MAENPSGRLPHVPSAISEVLAREARAQFVCDVGDARSSLRLPLAPFDDLIAIFVPFGSPVLEKLRRSPDAELLASSTEPPWSLRMQGRALHTGLASSHPRRLELAPWLPDGSALHRMHLVEFVPERIEYVEGQGESRQTWHGPTEAARTPSAAQRWFQACFGGLLPFAALGCVMVWVWLGWWGYLLPYRWLALALALWSALAALGASRLLFLTSALERWQKGAMDRSDARIFGEALLSVRDARLVAWVLLATVGVALLFLLAAWGGGLLLTTFLASWTWMLGPLWLLRLHSPREMERIEKPPPSPRDRRV